MRSFGLHRLNARVATALVLSSSAALVLTLLGGSPARAADATIPTPDGLSAMTAAASCWEIKELEPTAPSGIYWLATAQLGAPDRFYCDQSTNGGGWLLIGRGREAWSTSNEGTGTSAQVREEIAGQAAFSPRQLSSHVIGALLNGADVGSLSDGIRLRRATNVEGTAWQEVSFTITSPRAAWSWMFDNEQRVGQWDVGGVTGSGGTTNSFGSGTTVNRVQTTMGATQGWVDGFGFGTASRGTTSASSYIWAPNTTSGNPRPFTQVFLRPRLMSSGTFSDLPDSGTPKKVGIAMAQSLAERTVWGVAGVGAGPASIEGSNEVSAFAEANGVMYVGGNFTRVQKTSSGGSQEAQAYLAAFNVITGQLITTFRPTFNNQIKALAALPDGRIAAGGYFTSVNGAARAGLVVLDPLTGATDARFTGHLVNRLSGGGVVVRALDVHDNWLYAGGSFTHSLGGASSAEAYTRAGARFSVGDGTPDRSWNPEFNGTAISLDASSRGDRVYFAGYFTQSRASTALKAAAITTSTGVVIPWTIAFSNGITGANYQQTVKEVGDHVWLGGAQHMFFSFDRTTLAELSTNITKQGGDFQASTTNGTVVYGGCHCYGSVYVGARTWPSVGHAWSRAERINSVGAWDASTGQYLAQFSPTIGTRSGGGGWALFSDSRGVLWAGGDYSLSHTAGYAQQWSGGFVRFAPADSSEPTTPSALSVVSTDNGVRLSWTGSTDDRGGVTYHVLRQDRVVATTTATTLTLPGAPAGTRYFVRAADGADNWSASTTSAVASPASAPADPSLIETASLWKYWYEATAPATAWKSTTFDDSAWSAGAAPLGYGHKNLGTTLISAAPKPVTSYYRKSFVVSDASSLASVNLTTRADDGVVVYVNGTEVLRRNMDAGIVGNATYANVAPGAATAVANPIAVVVPGSAFVDGTNVIAAEVHSNYRTTPSHSFELTATGNTGVQPISPQEPVAPTPPAVEEPGIPGEPEQPATAALIPSASAWAYWYSVTPPAAGWSAVSYPDTSWAVGVSPLGYGQAGVQTTLSIPGTIPVTSYYRRAFTIADANLITAASITTRADDGVVVYVNGVEVMRRNLHADAITHTTYANTAVGAAAAANPITAEFPVSLLASGNNVITAEVHSNYRNTPSHSFDLTATATWG